jgi:hypothetical protein
MFNQHVRPMERARGIRHKYVTYRLAILTCAIWKGVLPDGPDLLPMSDDLLRAFLWDALAFKASLSILDIANRRKLVSILKLVLALHQPRYAVLAWHQHLRLVESETTIRSCTAWRGSKSTPCGVCELPALPTRLPCRRHRDTRLLALCRGGRLGPAKPAISGVGTTVR